MSQLIQIKCDLCGKILNDSEVQLPTGLLHISNKPKSKCNLAHQHEGLVRKGDICFNCSRKVRDYLDDIKAGRK